MRLSWCIFFFTSTNKIISYYLISVKKLYGFYPECLFKLSKSTPSVLIYGETGTTPLHIIIEKRMIGYWLRILMGSSSKLNYQIYTYILHLDMQNIYST